MPFVITPSMHAVAKDIQFLMGLWASADETEPTPLSVRFVAERCGLSHHMQASRILRKLCALDFIRHVDDMTPTKWPAGTKLFVPGGAARSVSK